MLGLCMLSLWSHPPKQLAQMGFHPNLWKNLFQSWVQLLLIFWNVYTKRGGTQAVEKSHCSSYTKKKVPRVDKLRPVSLTDCFAKIGEGFVTNWVLEDIQDKIDPQQFGYIEGISTSYSLVSLLHTLHQGAERSVTLVRWFWRISPKPLIWLTITSLLRNLSAWEFADLSSHGCVTLSATEPNVFNTIKQCQSTKFLALP